MNTETVDIVEESGLSPLMVTALRAFFYQGDGYIVWWVNGEPVDSPLTVRWDFIKVREVFD